MKKRKIMLGIVAVLLVCILLSLLKLVARVTFSIVLLFIKATCTVLLIVIAVWIVKRIMARKKQKK